MAAILADLVLEIYGIISTPAWQSTTSIIGTVVVFVSSFRLSRGLWRYLKPSQLPIYCHSQTGSWALVTGASDGIGRGFADELLERGFNVLLHGRNPEKLKGIRDELSKAYPRRSVDIVVADASKHDDSYTAVTEKVTKLPGKLTVLVNNIGGIATKPQYVSHAETTHANIDVTLNINNRFALHLTKDLIPVLRDNTPSLILNCGSTGAFIPAPYIATYLGTKAFVHTFTLALRNELVAEGAAGIEVLGVLIGNVRSAGNQFDVPGTISSRQCAAACLNRVGCGAGLMYAHWTHAAQFGFVNLMPEWLLNKTTTAEMQKRVELEKKRS